ncbi:beta-galactosidase [Xanthomonas translucens]|uniref:beta-galactosidase n=1 Tax=Xanthomonas campestris pv. translucens TaxID=343 RepID=UPI000AB6B527|nr:beta-galactosidase [Xanthomonas translucens]MCT8283326.1 beta-galactosidase [Xanthomonas translucens pv. undulosa]MCT8318543.1 beta-galactosidase [Xanthomonas translucens pv. undulosa]WLA12703.1 beta-galactosidase [Xanthomonas translucens]WLA16380.1 beta-galactosidase [Xanthomonas translucens]
MTHWGEADFARRDYLPTLRRLLAHGHSFNLYVVHGGSNFGLSAGANADDDGSNFQPALTSYDYAAPIDERGDPDVLRAARGDRGRSRRSARWRS